MAHPYNEHRSVKVSHDRVKHITGGLASGGAAHSDEAADKKLITKMVKKEALNIGGAETKPRMDRNRGGKVNRASGGQVKKSKGTTVNVIVSAPGGGEKPAPALTQPVVPPPGPAIPPRPPVAPPGPPVGVGGPPPGMPMRARGGKVKKAEGGSVPTPRPRPSGSEPQPSDLYSEKQVKTLEKNRAKGGKVSGYHGVPKGSISDDANSIGIGKQRTPAKHTNEKADEKPNLNRKSVITKKTGGPITSDGRKGKQMAPNIGAGAGGGKERLFMAHRMARKH